MKKLCVMFLIGFLAVSCSKDSDIGTFGKAKVLALAETDIAEIVKAISEYEGTTNFNVVLTEDWGKTKGITEYRVKIALRNDPQATRSYWLTHETNVWLIVSREL